MTTSNFTTVILKPEEGHFLTQKKDVDIRERIVASTIALGKNDSIDNYIEIDAETADAYRAEQQKAIDEEIKKQRELSSVKD